MLEIIKPAREQARYTLFIPFTRDWLVDDFLGHLDTIAMPLGSMEFIFYNDTDNMSLQGKLREYLEHKSEQLNNASLFMSRLQEPTEADANIRRSRIIAMKNKSRDLIDSSHYTICMEDDTFILDTRAVYTLINHIDRQENIGFVGGVQRGRWGFNMIGAWHMNNVKDPTEVSTMPYRASGVQEVDGAGMYFYITPTNLYKRATYHYEAECLGPDVCYVWDLRKAGYECFVDWNIVCEHRTNQNRLLPDETAEVFTYKKGQNGWIIMPKIS